MRTSREPHALVGAYALDAIAGKDLVRFERHLTSCARCAGRLRALREAAACLGAGPVFEPPPGLAERAIAAAARTPQLPAAGQIPRAGRPRAAPRVAAVAAGISVIAAGFLGVAARRPPLPHPRAIGRIQPPELNRAPGRAALIGIGGRAVGVIVYPVRMVQGLAGG